MHGTLPELLKWDTREEKAAFLGAYALSYLKEELWGVIIHLKPYFPEHPPE
jgi:hypothetical protein